MTNSTSPPQSNQLPPQFRETAFRRYENTLKQIIDQAPEPFRFEVLDGLSLETVSCRLRDAMRSLHDNKWKTIVDRPKFEDYYPRLQVCREGNTIVVKSKGSQSSLKTKQVAEQGEKPITISLLGTDNQADIGAISRLIYRKYLKAVLFLNIKETYEPLVYFARNYDLELIQQGDDVLML